MPSHGADEPEDRDSIVVDIELADDPSITTLPDGTIVVSEPDGE